VLSPHLAIAIQHSAFSLLGFVLTPELTMISKLMQQTQSYRLYADG
jgi:hypothetical protein